MLKVREEKGVKGLVGRVLRLRGPSGRVSRGPVYLLNDRLQVYLHAAPPVRCPWRCRACRVAVMVPPRLAVAGSRGLMRGPRGCGLGP